MSHLTATLKEFEKYFKENNINLKDKILLDVGCKDHSSKGVMNYFGLVWQGIDIKPQQPQGSIQTMDMTTLNFEDEMYDVVFVCHSLEHCENPLQALKEFKRIVKTGGYIFISMPCPCISHILESDEDHIFCFTDMQLKRLFTYVGFKEFEIFNGKEIITSAPHQYNLIGVAKK